MSVVRRLARPMLAAIYVTGGIGHFKGLEHHVQLGRPILEPVRTTVTDLTGVELSDELLVKASGAAMVGAGTLFALGRLPRLSSAVLAATMVPTTLAGHAFWKETDPQARQMQQIQFYKNLGLAGGALLGMVDTEGKPGLKHRARTQATLTRRELKALAAQAALEARLAAAKAR
ncbi:DoxX family protein [Arsenicicoccus dermatophilus]|uniref:DoxX family protein n=1 Tax=Arsenicicoccus dermatophilus TaxID=1076331 RepID=UPI00391726B0